MRVIFFILFIFFNHNLSADRRALIITIGNYPITSGWSALSSHNDAVLLKEALIRQGFKEGEIHIIQDQKATKKNIIEAIDLYLVRPAQKGDIAFFHFSGHGQQVADNNGDELDGYDEALVPYDSPMNYRKGIYEGEKLLRDDELGELMTQLRLKLGTEGQVLTILDACHSGTGIRGFGTARGTGIKMASADYNAQFENKRIVSESWEKEDLKGNMASMVAFFASASNQLNYENLDAQGFACGSLSYAFSKAFSKAKKFTSYQALFNQIQLEMSAIAPRQTPLAEGDLQRTLLGGKINGFPTYYQVTNSFDDYVVFLNAGRIGGLYPNSKIVFYPIDTRDTTNVQPINTGKIIASDLFKAQVELDKPMKKQQIKKTWAFMSEKNYGNIQISLRTKPEQHPFLTYLKKEAANYDALKFDTLPPDLELSVVKKNNQECIIIKTPDNYTLFESTLPNETGFENTNLVSKIIETILMQAQAKFLRHLTMDVQGWSMEMQLIPSQTNKRNTNEMPSFAIGEQFRIQVTNNSNLPLYYTILDIQPDNKMAVAIPHAYCDNRTKEEYYLLPKSSHIINCDMELSEPTGTEVYKLIATTQPIDLNRIINDVSFRGNNPTLTPFEQLFASSFKASDRNMRGKDTYSAPMGAAIVKTLIFEIKKKERN